MTEIIVAPEDIETPELEEELEEELLHEEPVVPPTDETTEQKDARIAALEERNKKLFARIQRDKDKSKKAPPQVVVTKKDDKPAKPAPLTREEGILIAKGFTEEEVAHAQKVATLQGVPLTDAVNDSLFKGWKSERDAEAKREAAQLPAGRGSRAATKKNFSSPGLSDEDHKALFKEEMGG